MWSRQLIMSNSTITKSYWYTRNQTNLYIGVKPSSRHSLDHVHLFDLAWYMTYLFEGNAFPFYEAPTSASQLFYLSRNNTECGTLYSGFPLCNNLSGLSTHCWGNWHFKKQFHPRNSQLPTIQDYTIKLPTIHSTARYWKSQN